jgi:hypothetical protein
VAESFVDTYKTELIQDRIWRTTTQLELATVEYIGWFNHDRLHSALGYRTPAEAEARWRESSFEPLPAQAAPTASQGQPILLASPTSGSDRAR